MKTCSVLLSLCATVVFVPTSLTLGDDTQSDTPVMLESLVFGDTVGINVHFDQGETRKHLETLVDLGVRWVRDSEPWSAIEAKPGVYEFPGDLPERLEFYKKHNIGVCFGLWYGNRRAYPDTPYDVKAYGRYAAAVATQLEQLGVRYVLEIWNEPHNFGLGPDLGGNWNAQPPSPWADRYLAMVHEAVRVVKEEVPTATLLINEDAWPAHYWFTEAGVPQALDGVAIHPYAHGVSPGPEVVPFGPEIDWARPFVIVDEDRSLRSVVRRLRARYGEALGKDPSFWATEWSYPLGKRLSTQGLITEELSAAYLPRIFITAAGAGIRATFWHTLQDMNDGPYGLIQNDGKHRRTYSALKTLTQQLGDTKMVRQIAGQSQPTSGVQAYLFEAAMGHRVAAWVIDGTQQVNIETLSTMPLLVFDNLGQPVKITYLPSGLPTVILNDSPVYIRGVDADVTVNVYPSD